MAFDLFDTRVATDWGYSTLLLHHDQRPDCKRMMRRQYSNTMRRIRSFLTGHGEVDAAEYLKKNALSCTSASSASSGADEEEDAEGFDRQLLLQAGGALQLHLEQLFTWRSLSLLTGMMGTPNPLPDAYDRHPEMRYMVANLRCATPLTHDVLHTLQAVIDKPGDALSQTYLPLSYDDEDSTTACCYYAASASPHDIAIAARGAGFSKDLIALLADIEAVAIDRELPRRFYSVLADMQREAREPQREASYLLYLCRKNWV
jgi:hypothetical protein